MNIKIWYEQIRDIESYFNVHFLAYTLNTSIYIHMTFGILAKKILVYYLVVNHNQFLLLHCIFYHTAIHTPTVSEIFKTKEI